MGLLALLLVMVIGFSHQSSVEAGELNFSIKPIYPDNQADKNLGYYDLTVTPGQKQTIELELTNQADRAITVSITPTVATTSNSGQINYQDFDREINPTLKYPLTSILKLEEKQVLQPKEVKKVPMTLDVPQESFDGMILGGLIIRQEDEEEEDGEGQIQIVNKFVYEISVKLTENDAPVQPDLEMLSARGSRYLKQNVMQAQLQNPEPAFLSKLKIAAKVYKKGSQTPLYQKTDDNIDMAPNSDFYYSVPLKVKKDGVEKNMAFEAGKYEMEIMASNEQGEWKFRKEFEITQDEAKKMNEEAEETDELEYPINWVLWISIGAGAFLVILIVVIWLTLSLSKRKKQKQRAQRKSKNKSKSSKKSSSNKKK